MQISSAKYIKLINLANKLIGLVCKHSTFWPLWKQFWTIPMRSRRTSCRNSLWLGLQTYLNTSWTLIFWVERVLCLIINASGAPKMLLKYERYLCQLDSLDGNTHRSKACVLVIWVMSGCTRRTERAVDSHQIGKQLCEERNYARSFTCAYIIHQREYPFEEVEACDTWLWYVLTCGTKYVFEPINGTYAKNEGDFTAGLYHCTLMPKNCRKRQEKLFKSRSGGQLRRIIQNEQTYLPDLDATHLKTFVN